MPKENIYISKAFQELLRTRAVKNNLTLSCYLKELVDKGYYQEQLERREGMPKVFRDILQVVIQIFLIQCELVPSHQKAVIEKARGDAKAILEKLLVEKDKSINPQPEEK